MSNKQRRRAMPSCRLSILSHFYISAVFKGKAARLLAPFCGLPTSSCMWMKHVSVKSGQFWALPGQRRACSSCSYSRSSLCFAPLRCLVCSAVLNHASIPSPHVFRPLCFFFLLLLSLFPVHSFFRVFFLLHSPHPSLSSLLLLSLFLSLSLSLFVCLLMSEYVCLAVASVMVSLSLIMDVYLRCTVSLPLLPSPSLTHPAFFVYFSPPSRSVSPLLLALCSRHIPPPPPPPDRRSLTRPKSFVSTRLLSLEEAQARTQAPLLLQGAPLSFQGKFHTVLDLPADSVTLRSAKSEESLSSQHSGAGQVKLQRLRRPRSSSDGLALAASMEPQLLPQRPPSSRSRLPPSRSYDSLLPEEPRDPEEEEDDDEEEEDEEDEEGVYMLPDFSQDPASSWMAEDVIDFSPTFLEDGGPIGMGGGGAGGRESPPAATPPPYRCVGHQGHAHSRSHSQRSITEDPDSVLNQTEAAARRSLILAATAPPQQVFCQHRPPVTPVATEPNTSPSHGQPGPAPSSQPPPERRSFTRKVVHALSPKAPKSPPLDISDPIAISVPAKVLEMIGGRAGELQPGPQGGGSSQPPQMISMLLRSCDFQLTESCQQEIRSKLGPDPKVKGFMVPSGSSQQPPPPPPKNPARLMALALAESANKALRQGASPPYRPPQPQPQHQPKAQEPLESRFMRSLSVDAAEVLSAAASPTDANQLYSTVRPLSVWMSEGENNAGDASEGADPQSGRSQGQQDTGTLSSQTSVSESGGSNSEVSPGSSSGDTDQAPSPVYKNQEDPPQGPPPGKPGPPPFPEDRPGGAVEAQAQRKPPAYSRQFSAPHLQNKGAPQSKSPPQQQSHHPQLLHSKSEFSPLAQVRAFQPTRPKVPPKPLELAPPQHRAPLTRADNYMRRSLDAARIRRIIAQSQGSSPNPPLSRAFSERISGTSDATSRYHAARGPGIPAPQPPTPIPQPPQVRPAAVTPAEDQGKMENFYYEIAAPEHPQAPPSYAWHSYQNMRLDLEGNYRPSRTENAQRPLSRGQGQGQHPHLTTGLPGARAPQLWSSEATRAWAAAHSHSHSYSFSHAHSHSHHHSQDGSPVHLHQHHPNRHPLPHHRHASSSVRLSRSEMHPALTSAPPLSLSVHKQRGAPPALHPLHPHRSPSADLTASQLHPYFENGKVCYRYFEATEDQPPIPRPSASHPSHPLLHLHNKPHPASSSSSPARPPDQPEPIYVNFPFTSPPPAGAAKSWITTDLDGDSQQGSEPPAPPPEPPPEEKQELPAHPEEPEGPRGPDSPAHPDPTQQDPLVSKVTSPSAVVMHYRSRSDPQSSGGGGGLEQGQGQSLTGKEIASLLIEKLAEDEGEAGEGADSPCAVTSSSTSSSPPPPPDHPPNPYPSQHHQLHHQPAYNVYTPGPSRSRMEGGQAAPRGGSFHRQDPLRRSASSGGAGHYRQAFDVMPSGDQVLKFYRSQDFSSSDNPNPYPARPMYQEPPYPSRSPQDPHPNYPAPSPSDPPHAFTARGYGAPPVGFQTGPAAPPYGQYQFQSVPMLAQYPNAPRREVGLDPSLRPSGLQNQRGLTRQGSLPGPNWTIHTEGQTRSYC
ncbi:hypothetical protein JZ751_004740 [Albula glossodonta]|uniref:Uncharacterized protein n=1 Tax=Albula glossodonta TaxID=121402 RepID=A0A8T2NCB9_9TELE|nr:hypothetical protein JZ751_004740 [Albula glossodonta]